MTVAENNKNIEDFITDTIQIDFPNMSHEVATSFVSKAFETGVIKATDKDSLNKWYQNNFKPNVFILDESIYTEACIQALKVQFTMAGTDFGTSRQRDLGQKWSDTIRGYLGEFGVKKLLENKFNISVDLGHELGTVEEYLESDIRSVDTGDGIKRAPNIKVSIKTTKSNGMWLDIPGDQFKHSDLYILALIGVDTNHLFSFFKHLSVFKDKILKKGVDEQCITQTEADDLYDKVPSFTPIYGYVPGIVEYSSSYDSYRYEGKKGSKNYKITNWTGKYEQSYLKVIKRKQTANKVEFLGIGSFSQTNRYIFGLPSLKFSQQDWESLCKNRL